MHIFQIQFITARLSRIAIGLMAMLLVASCSFGQDFFPVRGIRLGRLQLEELHVRQATVSEGQGEQGEYKQPVRLVFGSGRVTLFSINNKSVLFSGKLASGSSLSAIFECSGGPCVAPHQMSIDAGGMKLTVTIDKSTVPQILGGSVTLVGAQIKIGGSTKLEIKKDRSEGTLVLRSTSFALTNFSFRLSAESDPLVTDLSSSGESLLSLDLAGDSLHVQKAMLVKNGFNVQKPYRIVLEDQTITGPELSAAKITLQIPGKTSSARAQQQPPRLASLEVTDLRLKTPTVRLAKYPDYDVTGVSQIDCHIIDGDIFSISQNSAPLSNPVVKVFVVQPDQIQIINKLNATAQGKSILPTGNSNVRYIHAQVLRNLYEALGYTEDEQGGVGRTIYLPIKDGVIYDIMSGTFPIKDPGTTDPPVLVEAVSTIVGALAGEAGGELLGDLLKKPLKDASLGLSLNSMLMDPRLGVPTAWITYKAGTFGTKEIGQKLGEVPAETVAHAGGEIAENVLVEPVLHGTKVSLASALVRYLEVPPPVIPPSTVIVNLSNDTSRAQAFRKERIAFISTDALNASARQSLPPEMRARIESYERQLEWAVNNKFTFRQDVYTRIEPAWRARQTTKLNQYLDAAKNVEDQRREVVNSAAESNAALSAKQENFNDQQKAESIGQMQQQMDSQMSGFGRGMRSSYGNYGASNQMGPTPSSGIPGGTGARGTMNQGQGCRDMYQGCFQQPGKVYVDFDDPFIITAKKPKKP